MDNEESEVMARPKEKLKLLHYKTRKDNPNSGKLAQFSTQSNDRIKSKLYQQAEAFHLKEIHVVSTDEKTGIQALERIHPTRPMRANQPETVEFEYERHGTQALIANFEVATGKILSPSVGETRIVD